MKRRIISLAIIIFFILPTLCLANLKYNELKNKPEFWPDYVSVVKDIRFNNQVTLKKGQKYPLEDCTHNSVNILKEHRGTWYTFELKVAETDILTRANQLYNSLTDEQRKINYSNIQKYKEYWPREVRATSVLTFGNRQIVPGEKFILEDLQSRFAIIRVGHDSVRLNTDSLNIIELIRKNINNPNSVANNKTFKSESDLVPCNI